MIKKLKSGDVCPECFMGTLKIETENILGTVYKKLACDGLTDPNCDAKPLVACTFSIEIENDAN